MGTARTMPEMRPAPQAGPDLRRPAPRPLLLHLALANLTMLSSFAGLPHAKLGSMPWSAPLAPAGAELAKALASVDPEAFFQAVAEAAHQRLAATMRGIALYRRHPYRRRELFRPILWQQGAARLLDYGGPDRAPVLLFAPSLVNRAHILDLTPRQSLLRYLAGRGFRVLLLDWGAPGPLEQDYGLADYVTGPLAGALAAACDLAGGPVGLAGYCLGGNLTLAAAQLWPARVGALALLATPWDFHAEGGVPILARQLLAVLRPSLEHCLGNLPALPVDLLQALFLGLDPALGLRKFSDFAALDQASATAAEFVALEEWLNEGVPLTRQAGIDCLLRWYGENRLAAGRWSVAGTPVVPSRIACPSLVVLPQNDRIVPEPTAAPLGRLIPAAQVLTPRAGHIGMVVGRRAQAELWHPLADWFEHSLQAGAGKPGAVSPRSARD